MSIITRKHSKKRIAILETIRSSRSHPSAHWVYEQLKPSISGLSLATVYRNITLFQEEGSVVSVGVVNGKERFDGIVDAHPHFICTQCGMVNDLPAIDTGIFAPLADSHKQAGYSIDYRKTSFYGLCSVCSESSNDGVSC